MIALYDEEIPTDEIILIDPSNEVNQVTLTNYRIRELQVPIVLDGKVVYQDLSIEEKRKYCECEMKTIYPEIKRYLNPHLYYVDLSRKLLMLKKELINEYKLRGELDECVKRS